jgi:hypothetical protein
MTLGTQFWLSAGGGVAGLIGSLLLAYSLNPALAAIRVHVLAVETTAHATAAQGPVPVFTGFDKQVERAWASSSRRVRTGAWLLALGFALQVLALFAHGS